MLDEFAAELGFEVTHAVRLIGRAGTHKVEERIVVLSGVLHLAPDSYGEWAYVVAAVV